ncbi:hypothetical protein ABIE91_007663 [Bradyrhizobium elkanii]
MRLSPATGIHDVPKTLVTSALISPSGCAWCPDRWGKSRIRLLSVAAACAVLAGCAASKQDVVARLGDQYIGQNIDRLGAVRSTNQHIQNEQRPIILCLAALSRDRYCNGSRLGHREHALLHGKRDRLADRNCRTTQYRRFECRIWPRWSRRHVWQHLRPTPGNEAPRLAVHQPAIPKAVAPSYPTISFGALRFGRVLAPASVRSHFTLIPRHLREEISTF